MYPPRVEPWVNQSTDEVELLSGSPSRADRGTLIGGVNGQEEV